MEITHDDVLLESAIERASRGEETMADYIRLGKAYLAHLAARPAAASVRELLAASKEVLRKCDSEHEGVTIYDADRLRESITAVEAAPASADPRQIFDAGFAACRAYGDNHFHYRGEQADRVFAKAMERLNITPASAEVGK